MMEMLLGGKVVRAALRSDLADTGPAGLEMHVAMANPLRPPDTMGRVWVQASTEAFDALAVWCGRAGRTVPGATAQARAGAAAAKRTKTRIDLALDRLAKHPGYQGKATVGTDTTVLPARRCGGSRWWPTRRMALRNSDGTTAEVEAVMLAPEVVFRNGRTFTVWAEADEVAEVPPGVWG